jgi:hypothetical protein
VDGLRGDDGQKKNNEIMKARNKGRGKDGKRKGWEKRKREVKVDRRKLVTRKI